MVEASDDDIERARRGAYWADDVKKAETYTSRWSGCLLDGLDNHAIVRWVRPLEFETG